MKCLSLIIIAVWCSWMLHAQSSPASATTNSPDATRPPRAPTRIDSDNSADFDLNGHKAIYRGHVRVDDPEMKLTCAWLVADVPPAGGRGAVREVAEMILKAQGKWDAIVAHYTK